MKCKTFPGVDYNNANKIWRARVYDRDGKRITLATGHDPEALYELVRKYYEENPKTPPEQLASTHQYRAITNSLKQTRISSYPGVRLKKSGRWESRITFERKYYYLGTYDTVEEAITVRKEAEEELFEPFIEWYEQSYKKDKE